MRPSPEAAGVATRPEIDAGLPTLRDRVVLVTGGARGLGAAIGLLLAAEGARIAIADLAAGAAVEQAARLSESGAQALGIALDVGDARAVDTALRRVRDEWGGLDAVVNNAGIDVTAPIGELAVDDWERVLRTNLTGPFLVARGAAALMDERGGHIVNIASTASKRAWPNASAYHATKWGLLGLSHALHAELRPRGIKVSAVVAGGMRTPFLLERFADLDPGMLQDPMNVARAVRFVLLQPAETVVSELMVLPMRETSWP